VRPVGEHDERRKHHHRSDADDDPKTHPDKHFVLARARRLMRVDHVIVSTPPHLTKGERRGGRLVPGAPVAFGA
jgi:hypothetical protein